LKIIGLKKIGQINKFFLSTILRNQTMPIFEYKDVKVEVDEDGFIQKPEEWNEDVAKALATTEDVQNLTEAHWKIIYYLRDYNKKYGIAPMIRKLCKETGFSLKEIYELYPSGPAKGACKVAGLTKPTGCV
jgi:dissimilatory sulfite reductase related protein